MRFPLLATVLLVSITAPSQTLAPTPPMGWNSWDAYGTTIDEPHFRASAAWVAAHLKPFGYQYVTIDMEWFDANPTPEGNTPNMHHTLDANGRYLPDPARFPSSVAGEGFAPIAAYVHSLGLKFGIHILQGIPKEAVAADSLIANSSFKASEAGDTSKKCTWNPDNFGVSATPAGQAYYDSLFALYAQWGVDLVKVDCIAANPYKADEIRMVHQAILHSGRAIALSLSPGEAPIEQLAQLRKDANQWRISNDIWDLWHSKVDYPQGLNDQFPRLQKWADAALISPDGEGHWPDSDMLPLGHFPAAGWGKPRSSQLTADEQRTLINLWSIFRSPLMYGGDAVTTDAATLALLTNREVIDVDQHSRNNKCLLLTEALAIWTADPPAGEDHYLAVFNRQDTPQTISLPWPKAGLPASRYRAVDLWSHKPLLDHTKLEVVLPAHASAILRLSAERPAH